MEMLTAEQLLLLALAHDPSGDGDAAAAARVTEHLLTEYPDSVFSHALKLEQRRAQIALRRTREGVGSADPAAIHADYDADLNGVLDHFELSLALRMEPTRFGELHAEATPYQSAGNLMTLYDRDGRPGLSVTELTQVLDGVRNRVGSRVPSTVPPSTQSGTRTP